MYGPSNAQWNTLLALAGIGLLTLMLLFAGGIGVLFRLLWLAL